VSNDLRRIGRYFSKIAKRPRSAKTSALFEDQTERGSARLASRGSDYNPTARSIQTHTITKTTPAASQSFARRRPAVMSFTLHLYGRLFPLNRYFERTSTRFYLRHGSLQFRRHQHFGVSRFARKQSSCSGAQALIVSNHRNNCLHLAPRLAGRSLVIWARGSFRLFDAAEVNICQIDGADKPASAGQRKPLPASVKLHSRNSPVDETSGRRVGA
jgi:hypothetical protein